MSPYGNIEIGELVTMLVDARNIEEQVDILHFLVVSHGLDYKIHVKQVWPGLEISTDKQYPKLCMQGWPPP